MDHLTVEKGAVTTVTLQHPPANALSSALIKELRQVFAEIRNQEDVKIVLLNGEGKFFSAGANISEFAEIKEKSEAKQLSENGQLLMEEMEALPVPIVAAIHGAALGGGLELAMAAHIRFASEKAKLGLPEINLGLLPGFAGTQRLPKLTGSAKALELMLSGEPIKGEEAAKIGLVNRALPEEELLSEARAFCEKVASKSINSIHAIMSLIPNRSEIDGQDRLENEKALFSDVFVTEDGREGVQAFIDKRQPNFKDK